MNKVYNAIALSDKIPNGRTSGQLEISTHLNFKSDKADKKIQLANLHIEAGGASGRLLFFKNPSTPGWSFYTDDWSILDDPAWEADAAVLQQILALKKKKKSRMSVYLAILFVMVGISYAGFFGTVWFKDFAIKSIAGQIPVEWEEKLGGMAFNGFSANVIKDKTLNSELSQILSPILKAAESDRKYKFRFYLVADKMVNAFALPGGIVIINSGLVKKTTSAEELAGVIAHEISHITRQHGTRQLIQSVGIYFLVQTLLGDIQGLLAILLDNSSLLLNLKFSRDFEREADDSGFRYLVESGINPSGMISFFGKLKKEEEKQKEGLDLPAIISTHPATAERISNLDEKMKNIDKTTKFQKISVDYSAFKNRMKRLSLEDL